jgi:hypothetical protein
MNSVCNIQGKKFKFNKFKFLEIFNKKEGFIEGNTNDETMKDLETKFNGKLQAYGIIYDEYIKEKLVSDVDISTLLGQTAKYNNEDFYISRKGVMRKLTWGYQNHGCLAPLKNITAIQKTKLKIGIPLKKTIRGGQTFYEKCTDSHIDNTGKVISDEINGETAWLDDLGIKYKFKQGDARDNSCPNGIEESINSITYSMIKSGEELGPTDECIRQSLTKQGELNKLNNELVAIASKMKSLINSVQVESKQDDTKISQQAKSLDEIIKDLNSDREKIKNLKKELFSLDGNVRDNKFLVDASNMQYVGWGVSLITVLVLGLYTMKK